MPLLQHFKLWAAGALFALASGGLIYGLWQRSEVSRLSAHAQALENRVAGLESSERAFRAAAQAAHHKRRAASIRHNRTQKELDDVLKAKPDWATQPVPDGLWDALRPKQYPTP